MKLVLIFLTSIFLFFGCNKSEHTESEKPGSLVFIDDLGREVLFDSIPLRIISMIPSVTENLFAIGAGEKLIGVTNFCNYPEQTKNILKVGDVNPDYELITSLYPDIIFIATSSVSSPMLTKFESLGLKVFVTNPYSIDDIITQIKLLGKITGYEENSSELAQELSKKVNDLRSNLPSNPKKSLIVLSTSPLSTTNGKTFISKAIELAGFLNIFEDESSEYPTVGYEDVILKNPEYIIIPGDKNNPSVIEKIFSLESSLETTDAVRNKNYIFLNPDIFLRSSPRLILEIEKLSQLNF